jgi:hypothetical protein
MSNNDKTIRAAGAGPPTVDQAYETDSVGHRHREDRPDTW